ncbi:sulfotransferase [Alteromonas sp. W364]|uniref:sulfotransferase family protein n=1 Tax=Alteromonas sp. W364 TaxID=3075610 RepID=UPI002885D1C6|nr:sulfotransferase [Alteromonas sp. W364]MDT0627686.1 sulfotransferase [Alteromonas sp. W364]
MENMQKHMKSLPIFVMGTQRSGTTLLTRILSAHKKIFVQNEAELPIIFNGETEPSKVTSNIKAEILRHDDIDIDKLLSDGYKIWGLKDPQLTEHIEVLKNFLPDTKFIIILRDGRGVANSYIENKWGLGTNVYTGAQRWKREVRQQIEFMNSMPENFFFIKFEDMVGDLESSMRNICNFLNIDFDEEMLDYNNKESFYEIKTENRHTFKKPDMKLTKKWQQKLSKFEISVIENVAGDVLDEFGYERLGNTIKLSKLRIFYYQIHQAILGEIQLQYKWRRHRFFEFFKNLKRK